VVDLLTQATSRIGSGLVQGHSLAKGTPSQMPGGPDARLRQPEAQWKADGTLAEAHQPGQGVARTIPVPGATGPSSTRLAMAPGSWCGIALERSTLRTPHRTEYDPVALKGDT